MDIHFTSDEASPDERQAVDSVLGQPEPLQDGGARTQRNLLLPVLHAIQARLGWITPAALNYACQRLDLPPAEAYGVASFYGLFSVVPRPLRVLHVCDDIACLTRGSEELCRNLEQDLGPAGSPTLDGKAV